MIDINSLFASIDNNKIDEICNYLKILDDDIEQITDFTRPLLNGKRGSYYELVGDAHLSSQSKDPKDVLKSLSSFFSRAIRWQHPGVFINVIPPANIPSIAAATYASLYNANVAQDENSGYLSATELIVVKHMATLANWDWKQASGLFTFGGKGTCLYGIKAALNAISPTARNTGVHGQDYFVLTNEKAHPFHPEVCDWLGIGIDNCIKLPVEENGQVSLRAMREEIDKNLQAGRKLVCIMLNGGNTNEIIIDPIDKVSALRDEMVEKYKLDYVPHIHVDAVIGWAWLFYKTYNFSENPLSMSAQEIEKISSMRAKILQLELADSYGADFHKTGFCPYTSSLFMIKDGRKLYNLGNKKKPDPEHLCQGSYSPFEYSLELTRSASGPISAYVALETFGVEGYQKLIYNVFSNGEYIRSVLEANHDFDVINLETEGFATLFIAKPPGFTATFKELIKMDAATISKLVDYNDRFYLFTLEALESGAAEFKITFSKSYKPFGCASKTGALKIYQMSPIATKTDIARYLHQLVKLKENFDAHAGLSDTVTDSSYRQVDFIYRQT